MKVMRKSALGYRRPRTLGELLALAFDISPSRAAAVKMVQQWMRGDDVHFDSKMNSGNERVG